MKATIFIFLSLLLTSEAYSRTVARVTHVKGNAFTFGSAGGSKSLGFGSKIEDLSEVMVEDGSSLTLINNSDDVFHVNGGSLVKFFNGSLELKNGHIWVEAKTEVGHIVHTSNSVAQYKKGQFIYSHDNVSGKTQLLVLAGQIKFSNALEPNLKVNVPSGFFTFVEQGYENGLPRRPTKVGLNSYKKIRSAFVNFDSLKSNDFDKMLKRPMRKMDRSRGIASVEAKKAPGKKKGKLITFTTYSTKGRVPASAGTNPLSYYKNIKKKERQRFKPQKTGSVAKVRMFGAAPTHHKKSVVIRKGAMVLPKRAPASVAPSGIVRDLRGSSRGSMFEDSLRGNVKRNQKHSSEVNNLIDELKSYKKDYNKNY